MLGTRARLIAGLRSRITLLSPRLVLVARLLIAELLSPSVAESFPARIVVAPIIVPAMVVALGIVPIERRAHFIVLLRRFAEQSAVMLGVLKEALGSDPVAGELSVARQGLILVNDLLRRAAYLAVRTGALKYSINYISQISAVIIVIAIIHVSGVVPHAARLVPGS